jgi:transcriptional regulator with XRE-family HTH domain
MKVKSAVLQQFGQNIRSLREAQKLSQEEFAAIVGLDRTYIGGVERGERNAGVINLCRIALALSVAPADLLKELNVKNDVLDSRIADSNAKEESGV